MNKPMNRSRIRWILPLPVLVVGLTVACSHNGGGGSAGAPADVQMTIPDHLDFNLPANAVAQDISDADLEELSHMGGDVNGQINLNGIFDAVVPYSAGRLGVANDFELDSANQPTKDLYARVDAAKTAGDCKITDNLSPASQSSQVVAGQTQIQTADQIMQGPQCPMVGERKSAAKIDIKSFSNNSWSEFLSYDVDLGVKVQNVGNLSLPPAEYRGSMSLTGPFVFHDTSNVYLRGSAQVSGKGQGYNVTYECDLQILETGADMLGNNATLQEWTTYCAFKNVDTSRLFYLSDHTRKVNGQVQIEDTWVGNRKISAADLKIYFPGKSIAK